MNKVCTIPVSIRVEINKKRIGVISHQIKGFLGAVLRPVRVQIAMDKSK
jgi:hypothetical protein